jgi:hypothetical protein
MEYVSPLFPVLVLRQGVIAGDLIRQCRDHLLPKLLVLLSRAVDQIVERGVGEIDDTDGHCRNCGILRPRERRALP